MKVLRTLLLFVLFSLVLPGVIVAQSYQAPTIITSTVLSVNKTVQRPGTDTFVENLSTADAKYQPGNTVRFRITVTNTGNTTLTNIRVSDNFPQFLVNAADKQNTFTTTIPQLNPGQTQTIPVTGQVVAADAVPADQRVFCLVNQAVAAVGNQTSTDNAQICVENPAITGQTTKGGQPVYIPQNVTTVPKTGPEILSMAGLLTSALAGVILRKRQSK